MSNKFKFQKYNIFYSFKCAIKGAIFGITTEPSSRIQISIGIFFIILNSFYQRWDFLIFHAIYCIVVLSQEVMNTSIEYLCDMISLEKSEKIMRIKDLAAGSVFILAFGWGILILTNIIKIWL
ncbi:MAG: diacylglycerol kinase [Patescibacteria group bacterium]